MSFICNVFFFYSGCIYEIVLGWPFFSMCSTSIIWSIILNMCPVSSMCCANPECCCLLVVMACMCSYTGLQMYVLLVCHILMDIRDTLVDICHSCWYMSNFVLIYCNEGHNCISQGACIYHK